MENSVFSKPNTPDDSPEESSWTMYLQGFNNVDNDEQHTSFSSSSPCSLQKPASSLAPQQLSNYDNNNNNNCKKPWRKLLGVVVEDELEDTASSPVNSPKKVSYINHEGKGNFSISKGKGGDSGQNGMDARGKDDGDLTDKSDLKKKGLCLVPMSMITKYIG